MEKSELKEIINRMYDLRGTMSDEQINEDQYNYYIGMLNTASVANEKEIIREIVYELDISKPIVARKIAYPFSFNDQVMKWMRSQIHDGKYYCVACQTEHLYHHGDPKTELNIDHEPALSVRFNKGEYKLDKKARCASYNDISKLQLMCAEKNVSKGGVQYNPKYIQEVFVREL